MACKHGGTLKGKVQLLEGLLIGEELVVLRGIFDKAINRFINIVCQNAYRTILITYIVIYSGYKSFFETSIITLGPSLGI